MTGRIASFDIFDTVLTRRVADPRSAFLLLGRKLASSGHITCSSHAFARARTGAEQRMFRNSGGLDSSVNLRDIYDELGSSLHWSASTTDAVYQKELELEDELLVVVESGLSRVHRARQRGQLVIFVSDMYLPSDVLEGFLRDREIMQDGDIVIVSNEYSASKATGALWPKLFAELGVRASQLTHVGNDQRSDGRSARKAGLNAEVLAVNNPNRYEVALEAHAEETDGLSSALAGASRLARLNPKDPTRPEITDVSAGVVAPFVIGKLLWTLSVAKKEGLSELFFVARDGQILRDVAEILAPQVGYEGDLTYVYGSRQAWVLGGLTTVSETSLSAILPSSGDVKVTLREALARLELAPEEISVPLSHGGFHRATWDRLLTDETTSTLRQFLTADPDSRRAVEHAIKGSRELVLTYLEQVGAVTNEPIGFVDLGTGATLFNALAGMLQSVGQAAPIGFYFGMRENVPDIGFGKPMTYLRDEGQRLGHLKTPGFLTLVELACTADHGSVTGYEEVDGKIQPTFCEDGNDAVISWGLSHIHDTVRSVAEELLLDPDLVGVDGIDLRPAILDAFSLFWNSPTKQEAAAWGTYPFEDGWGDNAFRHPIAARQGFIDALRRPPHRHWWDGGASRLSNPITRKAMESRHMAKHLVGKVQRRIQ